MSKNPFFIIESIDSGQKTSLRWVEESYEPELTSEPQKDFLSLSLSTGKMKFLMTLVFIGLAALLAKSFYLQIANGGRYYSLAENNRIRINYVKAHRGIMYDQTGKVLVQNVFDFSLFITPSDLPKPEPDRSEVINMTAQIFKISREEIENKIKEASKYYFQPIIIASGIGYEQAMALKIFSSDLPGVSLEVDPWRNYIAGPEFSHVLGYVGKINAAEYESKQAEYLLSDDMGKTGLEQYYESYLKGEHGQKEVEVDALGHEKKVISQTAFIPGDDLILSIDAGLQTKIYQVLQDKLKNTKSAVVIVSNPQNGEILAMVDYPSYDNNLFSAGITSDNYNKLLADPMKPLFMRSIFGEYPSGSTVKPVIASGALQEKIITPNTTVNSTGGIHINQWTFPDWKAGGHGITNVKKAIAQSVNTFFYYIGGGYGDFKGLGLDGLVKYMRLFGLGSKLGIDLPGERSGFVPTAEWKKTVKKEIWYIGDTYHLSIGQGDLLVTPLQVNSYNSTIANGGTIYRPHILRGLVYPDKRQEFLPLEIIRQDFVDPANIKTVRDGMRETVVSGSARSLNTLPVQVAGKTGTAQWSSTQPNHAWFNGFAPFDHPTFSITVFVEAGGEGSTIATPIAKEILNYWFTRDQKK